MSTADKGSATKYLVLWYAITSVVVLLDLWTKKLASESLFFQERVNIFPFFDLTLRHNYGAAFSFLADHGGWQTWFFGIIASVVSVIITVWIYRVGREKFFEAFALSLILSGALGNLYDRVTLGYVVDFILVYYKQYQYPAFNIADSAITLGVILMLYDALFLQRKNNDSSLNDEG